MRVKDFLPLEKSGCLYRIVDASIPGYMTRNIEMMTADRNVMKKFYGEWEVVGFEPYSKKTITLFAKEL